MTGSLAAKKKPMIVRKAVNCTTENHPNVDNLIEFLEQNPEERHLDIAKVKQHKKPLKSSLFFWLSVIFFTLCGLFLFAGICLYLTPIFFLITELVLIPAKVSFVISMGGLLAGMVGAGVFLLLGFVARMAKINHEKKVDACLPKKIENLIDSNVVQSVHLPNSCLKTSALNQIAPKALDHGVAISVDGINTHRIIDVVNTIQKTESTLFNFWCSLLQINIADDIKTCILAQALRWFSEPQTDGPSPLHLLGKKLSSPAPRTIQFFDKEQLEAPIEKTQAQVLEI